MKFTIKRGLWDNYNFDDEDLPRNLDDLVDFICEYMLMKYPGWLERYPYCG